MIPDYVVAAGAVAAGPAALVSAAGTAGGAGAWRPSWWRRLSGPRSSEVSLRDSLLLILPLWLLRLLLAVVLRLPFLLSFLLLSLLPFVPLAPASTTCAGSPPARPPPSS